MSESRRSRSHAPSRRQSKENLACIIKVTLWESIFYIFVAFKPQVLFNNGRYVSRDVGNTILGDKMSIDLGRIGYGQFSAVRQLSRQDEGRSNFVGLFISTGLPSSSYKSVSRSSDHIHSISNTSFTRPCQTLFLRCLQSTRSSSVSDKAHT